MGNESPGVLAMCSQIDEIRLHDLWHSFASAAASGGQTLVIIGKMLGHSQPATTAPTPTLPMIQ